MKEFKTPHKKETLRDFLLANKYIILALVVLIGALAIYFTVTQTPTLADQVGSVG